MARARGAAWKACAATRAGHAFLPAMWACAVLGATGAYGKQPAPPASALSGVTIHHCSCAVGCPCMFGPTLTDCRMVVVHHVDHGSMQGQKLDGATVVTLLPSIQDLAAKPPPKFKAAIYVDKSQPRAVQELLVRMFTPKNVRVGKQLLATPCTVRFQRTAKGFRTEVPGYLVAETRARTGHDGKQVVVHHVDFAEGSIWRVGENVSVKLKEPLAGWNWDLTGRNGTWTIWKWAQGGERKSVDPDTPSESAVPAGHGSCCARKS